MQTKHILLTTDLSEEAQRAFRPVCALARVFGARITLLHVVSLRSAVAVGSGAVGVASPTDIQEETKRAKKIVDEQAELLDSEIDHTQAVVAAESVVNGIVDYAEENDVGLIALSTHGRSGLRRLVLGSIAELVLRHSHVPVLCFPPPK